VYSKALQDIKPSKSMMESFRRGKFESAIDRIVKSNLSQEEFKAQLDEIVANRLADIDALMEMIGVRQETRPVIGPGGRRTSNLPRDPQGILRYLRRTGPDARSRGDVERLAEENLPSMHEVTVRPRRKRAR